MEIVSLIATLGSVVFPPLFNLVKSLFGKVDSPAQIIANLATTKPEALEGYVKSQAVLSESETKFFNRDVSGTPSTWVIDLRACIRPFCVIASFIIFVLHFSKIAEIDSSVLITCQVVVGSWIGTKVDLHS